jgi:hypothetical protein
VLNDIAFGAIFEQPAGKDAPPLVVGGAAHIQLHERAGFGRIFPGGGLFAGLKADDGVADAQRFARFHGEVAGQAVAFVEQADDSDPVLHRRTLNNRVAVGRDLGALNADGAGLVGVGKLVSAATTGKEQQERQGRPRRHADHDASGLHAS